MEVHHLDTWICKFQSHSGFHVVVDRAAVEEKKRGGGCSLSDYRQSGGSQQLHVSNRSPSWTAAAHAPVLITSAAAQLFAFVLSLGLKLENNREVLRLQLARLPTTSAAQEKT